MKAVVWASTIQMFLMFTGVIVLAAKAIVDLGGWGPAFEIIRAGHRTNHFKSVLCIEYPGWLKYDYHNSNHVEHVEYILKLIRYGLLVPIIMH